MTFYELIRAGLLQDAEKHPYLLKERGSTPPDDGEKQKGPDRKTDP